MSFTSTPSAATVARLELNAQVLHPSTEPGVIAAAQRAEVAAVLDAFPHATVEQIGDHLTLSVWSVRVRLAELNSLPRPYPPKKITANLKSNRFFKDDTVRKAKQKAVTV